MVTLPTPRQHSAASMAVAAVLLLSTLLCIASAQVSCDPSYPYRLLNGACNNLANPEWGSSDRVYSRLAPPSSEGTWTRPHPRVLSNVFAAEPLTTKYAIQMGFDERRLGPDPAPKMNMLLVGFLQFQDHDNTEANVDFKVPDIMTNFNVEVQSEDDALYEAVPPPGFENITSVARNYPRRRLLVFFPFGQTVNGTFSAVNRVTSYLDLSQVYGPDLSTANKLRSNVDGKMKIGSNGFLPKNSETGTRSQCGGFGGDAFGAGDSRIDTSQVQVALHTIFVREHNRLCDVLKAANPSWTDEQLFQEARKFNIAQYQNIVMDEALPLFLGNQVVNHHIGKYQGYDSTMDATLSHEFSIGVSRIAGHLLVNWPQLNVKHSNCTNILAPGTEEGYDQLPNPRYYAERVSCAYSFSLEIGIENALRGAMIQHAKNPRLATVVNILRNGYSKGSTPGSLDILANDILRHRQFHVPSYIELVKTYRGVDLYDSVGCSKETTSNGIVRDNLACFQQITANVTRAQLLQSYYHNISNIDANIGLMDEPLRSQSGLPITAAIGYAKEMKRVRDGDRFWFERDGMFSKQELREIRKTTLADIIRRNTDLPASMVSNKVMEVPNLRKVCPQL